MSSPTQRSLKWLRDHGYKAETVERWIAATMRRKDLYGFIDIMAMHPHEGIVGIQTTTASNLSARIQKINGIEESRDWIRARGRIFVHGWKKRKVGKRLRWVLDARELTL